MENLSIKRLLENIKLKHTNIIKIEKGWSKQEKYIIDTKDGKLNLTIFEKENLLRKEEIFNYQKKLYESNIKVAKPIKILSLDNKCIALFEYIEGLDGEEIISSLPEEAQYEVGFQAGVELKKMHKLKAPSEMESWGSRKIRKHKRYEELYQMTNFKLENSNMILQFINDHLDLINDRPNVFQHDDYHLGNMIIENNNLVGIIDFDLMDFGDPYHDLIKAGNISIYSSEKFCIGQIDGYFYPEKPNNYFWKIYSTYGAMSAIASVVWLERHHPARFEEGMRGVYRMIDDHNNFQNIIPKWYKGE